MSKGSKAVNNGLSPLVFCFLRELADIKRESTRKKNQHQQQIDGGGGKDGRVLVKICLGMDVSQ